MKRTTIGCAALLVMLMGCAGTTSSDEGSIGEGADTLEEAPSKPETHDRKARGPKMRGPNRHGGPAMLLHVAQRELELGSEQREAIDASMKELEAPPPKHEDRADERKALADAVRAGSVDPAKHQPPEDPMREHRTRLASALEKLHETLTVEQRSALVNIVRERHERMDERMQERRQERGQERRREPRGDGPAARRGKPTDMLLHGIDVSDEQRTKIEAALDRAGLDEPVDHAQRHEQMKAKQKALLDAFVASRFDADALLDEAGRPKPRFAEALAVIVPLLDEGQRAELADRIEKGRGRPRH